MRPMICVCRYEQFPYYILHKSVGVHCLGRWSLKDVTTAKQSIWSFHLVEKNMASNMRIDTVYYHSQKYNFCFTFILLGYYSKEISRHHCKYL